MKKFLKFTVFVLFFFGAIYFLDNCLPQKKEGGKNEIAKKTKNFYESTLDKAGNIIDEMTDAMKKVTEKPKPTKKITATRKPVQQQVRVQTTRVQKTPEVQRLEAEIAQLREKNEALERAAERKRKLREPIPIPRADYIPVPRADYIPVPERIPRYYRYGRYFSFFPSFGWSWFWVSFSPLYVYPIWYSQYYAGQPDRFVHPNNTQYGNSVIRKNQLADPKGKYQSPWGDLRTSSSSSSRTSSRNSLQSSSKYTSGSYRSSNKSYSRSSRSSRTTKSSGSRFIRKK